MKEEFLLQQLKKKKQGFMLLSAVLSSIVFMMLAGSFFALYGGQFSLIQNGRTALQAQQYAEIDANTLSLLSYNNLDSGAHARHSITNIANATGWEDEIIVGPEQIIDESTKNKQRIATVNIYKTGDNQSRYSLSLPISSKGSSSVPPGSIISWYGNLSNIPSGFAYCDGTNETPDLRGRIIVGTGLWSDSFGSTIYNLGNVAGERMHQLTISEMPAHHHSVAGNSHWGADSIGIAGANGGIGAVSEGPDSVWWNNADALGRQLISDSGGDQPHNIMQPYMAVNWIMKI